MGNYCGKCRAPIESEQQACPECGSSIDWDINNPPPSPMQASETPPPEPQHKQQPAKAESGYTCPSCGSSLSFTQQSCSWCGASVDWGSEQFNHTPPVLQTWRTSVGFSILGLLVGFPVFMILSVLVGMLLAFGLGAGLALLFGAPGAVMEALTMPLTVVAGLTVQIVYAAKIYPSYFSEKPKIRSSKIISFANLMIGNLIFGCLWNSNLSKRIKGSSNTVFIVLQSLTIASTAFSIVAALISGAGYSAPSTTNPATSNPAIARVHPDTSISILVESSQSVEYIDNETGATFQVPSSWVETPLNKERVSIDIKWFIGDEGNEDFAVMYGSSDLWNAMTDAERAGLNPSDINNSFYTTPELANDLAFSFDASTKNTEWVTFGSNTFFKLIVDESEDASMSYVVLVYIDNGYYYMLQFVGRDQYYSEFEAFAASLTFAP